MYFRDRNEAGARLADALESYRGTNAVVCPLPRGGVALGVVIARCLNLPLDLVIPRKIGHPSNPEYAVCAVSEAGDLVCNESERARLDPHWLAAAVERERAEASRRRILYMGKQPAAPLRDRTAILVDDGIATGLTLRAAIRDVRARNASRVVTAVPIGPRDSLRVIAAEADEVVVLDAPEFFRGAVSAYYGNFPQLTDEDVLELLRDVATVSGEMPPD